MRHLNSFGFLELFGIESTNPNFFSTIANSNVMQNLWRVENGLAPIDEAAVDYSTLQIQIETYQPDIIYTNNPEIVNNDFSKTLDKKIKLVLWNASPILGKPNLSHFDLGLSFDSKYLLMLKQLGVEKSRIKHFSADKEMRTLHNFSERDKHQDLIFAGTVSDKFKQRINLLNQLTSKLGRELTLKYHLLAPTYRYTKIPKIPMALWGNYQPPIFMEKMLREFGKSKIILNIHSDMSSEVKGNMRVFEALANGSFLLTDEGIYPEGLTPGKHFVTYKSDKDAVDKIRYFANNDKEREEIALQGNGALVGMYSPRGSALDLLTIFEEII